MARYAAARVLQSLVVLVGATLVVFLAVFALPGDPVRSIGGSRTLPESTRQAIVVRYGLDQPLPVQYVHYMARLATGDLGESYSSRRPVGAMLRDTFPTSLTLALLAVAIEGVAGVLAGLAAAVSGSRFVDMLVLVGTALLLSVPIYVLGSLLQYSFGLRWHLLPVTGLGEGWRSWVLPALVLAAPALAYVARVARVELGDALDAEYVRTARAKGLGTAQVLARHTARPVAVPIVTFLAVDLGFVLGGAVVVETIFNLDGMGLAISRAISQRDNPTIIGFTLVLVTVFVVVNLVADLVVAVLDPRTRDA